MLYGVRNIGDDSSQGRACADGVRHTPAAPRGPQREPTKQAKIHERPGITSEVAAEATTVSGRHSSLGADVVISDPGGRGQGGEVKSASASAEVRRITDSEFCCRSWPFGNPRLYAHPPQASTATEGPAVWAAVYSPRAASQPTTRAAAGSSNSLLCRPPLRRPRPRSKAGVGATLTHLRPCSGSVAAR